MPRVLHSQLVADTTWRTASNACRTHFPRFSACQWAALTTLCVVTVTFTALPHTRHMPRASHRHLVTRTILGSAVQIIKRLIMQSAPFRFGVVCRRPTFILQHPQLLYLHLCGYPATCACINCHSYWVGCVWCVVVVALRTVFLCVSKQSHWSIRRQYHPAIWVPASSNRAITSTAAVVWILTWNESIQSVCCVRVPTE